MSRKIRVGVLFGGRSVEHEVSLQSAKNIVDALDRKKYDVVLIGIDKSGRWTLSRSANFLLNESNPKLIKLNKAAENVALIPGNPTEPLMTVKSADPLGRLDVIFPILHGSFGEDGTVQGLLKLANIPFVGASVLGSAVGMDKDVMKRLLRDAGIPIAKFAVYGRSEATSVRYGDVTKKLGSPVFVKPANSGSSVGIRKVKGEKEWKPAIDEALQFDDKVIVEEAIQGREIEVAVLGNEDPKASVPGEIIPRHEFYSYEAKYIDENGARLEIPAKLPEDVKRKVQGLAVQAFKVLCCEGMARVDFFVKENGEVIVNEINTIPGFTKISMYPKLWEASGISYAELIDRLITLALERFQRESKLKTSYE
ncbi:MAG TPA: D-alanine--D-alanine ligase [Bdellovibrionota bacterium]|nr:D-alanine--D-alanine ligase [Bdellovibrionota bacterium]